jgi:hypothetical protein
VDGERPAQPYPSKPIKWIVPYTPAGITNIMYWSPSRTARVLMLATSEPAVRLRDRDGQQCQDALPDHALMFVHAKQAESAFHYHLPPVSVRPAAAGADMPCR